VLNNSVHRVMLTVAVVDDEICEDVRLQIKFTHSFAQNFVSQVSLLLIVEGDADEDATVGRICLLEGWRLRKATDGAAVVLLCLEASKTRCVHFDPF